MRDLYEHCEQCGAPTARYTLLHLSEDRDSYGYGNHFHYELGGYTRRVPEVEIRAIRADLGHICATPAQVDRPPIDRSAPPKEASLATIQEASELVASTTGDTPGSVLDLWIRQNQGVTVKIGQSKYLLSALDLPTNKAHNADMKAFYLGYSAVTGGVIASRWRDGARETRYLGVSDSWKRGPIDWKNRVEVSENTFYWVIEHPDPTRAVKDLILGDASIESNTEQTAKKGSETMSVYERSKKNVGEGLQVGAGRKVAKRMNQKIKEAIVKTSGLDPTILDNKVLDALIYMLAPAALMTAAPHIPMIPQKKTQRALDFAQVGGSSIIGEDLSDVVEDILGPILGSMAEVVATSLGEDEDSEE